jgi:hypothetical protein
MKRNGVKKSWVKISIKQKIPLTNIGIGFIKAVKFKSTFFQLYIDYTKN